MEAESNLVEPSISLENECVVPSCRSQPHLSTTQQRNNNVENNSMDVKAEQVENLENEASSMLDCVSNLNIQNMIDPLFEDESEEYIYVQQVKTEEENGGGSYCPSATLTTRPCESEPILLGLRNLGVEIDFFLKWSSDHSFPISQTPSELQLVEEEKQELVNREVVKNSEDGLQLQISRNSYLLENMRQEDLEVIHTFAQISDQLLLATSSASYSIQSSQDILQGVVWGKSAGSCGVLDLWSSVLAMSIYQLKPPSNRRTGLVFLAKTRLKEILRHMENLAEVTTNIGIQTKAIQGFLNGLTVNSWKHRFQPKIWEAVMKNNKCQELFAVPIEQEARMEPRPKHGNVRSISKIPIIPAAVEVTLQFVWSEWSGLTIWNFKDPPVPYTKLNFLDRRTVFNAFAKETCVLLKRSMNRVNSVAAVTNFNIDNKKERSLSLHPLQLGLTRIEEVLKRKEAKLPYAIEALMINQIQRIERKLNALVSNVVSANRYFLRKVEGMAEIYRKQKKIFRGTSRRVNEKVGWTIGGLNEVAMNFSVPTGALDFPAYSSATEMRKHVNTVGTNTTIAQHSRTLPATYCKEDTPKGPFHQRKPGHVDSLTFLLSKNSIGYEEISLCSDQVQTFHESVCTMTRYLRNGIKYLGTLQSSHFAPIGPSSNKNGMDSSEFEIVSITGWSWVLTKGLEHLFAKYPMESVHEIGPLIQQFHRICKEIQRLQKSIAVLARKTNNTQETLQKLWRERNRAGGVCNTRRTLISASNLFGGNFQNSGGGMLEEKDVRIGLSVKGIRIEVAQQIHPFNELPYEKCFEILKTFVQHVNSEVKAGTRVFFKIQGRNSDAVYLTSDKEMEKIEKFLEDLNEGRILIKEYDCAVVAGTLQSLMTELSRFQAVVKYLLDKSTNAAKDVKYLEKMLERMGGGARSMSRSAGLSTLLGGGGKNSRKARDALKLDLQVVTPILIRIKGSHEIKSKLTKILAPLPEANSTTQITNELFPKSDLLLTFIERSTEMKKLLSETLIITAQSLHLPNSALSPDLFQVSKVEAFCAVIANGIIGLYESQKSYHYNSVDDNLLEKLEDLLKESQLLEQNVNNSLENNLLHSLRLYLNKLSNALNLHLPQEKFSPNLFWSAIVSKAKPGSLVSILSEYPKSLAANLSICWKVREMGLEFVFPQGSEPIPFSSYSKEERVHVLLFLIYNVSEYIQSTCRNMQEWTPDLKLTEEMLHNLKKEVKKSKASQPHKYEDFYYREEIVEIGKEISVAASCLENFRTTGQKLNSMLRAAANLLKIVRDNNHAAVVRSPDLNNSQSEAYAAKLAKAIGMIKTAWFTPVKVEVCSSLIPNLEKNSV